MTRASLFVAVVAIVAMFMVATPAQAAFSFFTEDLTGDPNGNLGDPSRVES